MATEQDVVPSNMVEKYWDKFFKANPNTIDKYSEEALNWFRVRISKDLQVKAEKIIQSKDFKKRSGTAAITGKLMLFEYEAESPGDRETGVYDRFPMVFMYDLKEINGNFVFYGLNVHYLTPLQRANLYKALMKIKTTKGLTANTRIFAEWSLIKQAAGSKIAERAVHAYRVDRMQSRFVEIPPKDWIVAVFLQLQRWVRPEDHTPIRQSAQRRKLRQGAK